MATKQDLKEKVLAPIIEAGFNAYFVGGCVRDSLLGIKPHDYDIATDATPKDIRNIFDRFSNVSENSEPFGVTMPLIKIGDSYEEIEIATLRKDITKGRHPKVEFTNLVSEDAARRDFTMNAIYEDIDGQIIDPTGGINDINNKVLRFVGKMEDRLDEDPLRLFRALRFLSKTGFAPAFSKSDFHAIASKLLETNRFDEVSKERQLKELEGIFGGKHFDIIFDELFWASLIPEIIGMRPYIDGLMGVKQSFCWHAEGAIIRTKDGTIRQVTCEDDLKDFAELRYNGYADFHTILTIEKMFEVLNEFGVEDTHKRFVMMVAAFCHDFGKVKAYKVNAHKHNVFEVNGIKVDETLPSLKDHDIYGKDDAYNFCKSLGMTNKESALVATLTERHMRGHRLFETKDKYKVFSFVKYKHFDDLLLLIRADERACVKTIEDEWIPIDKVLEQPLVKEVMAMEKPKQIVNGKFLIDNFGMKPSPIFKKIIDKAYRFQINHNIPNDDIEKMIKYVKNFEI